MLKFVASGLFAKTPLADSKFEHIAKHPLKSVALVQLSNKPFGMVLSEVYPEKQLLKLVPLVHISNSPSGISFMEEQARKQLEKSVMADEPSRAVLAVFVNSVDGIFCKLEHPLNIPETLVMFVAPFRRSG